MELGLSLGEPDAGRAAPELGLGLGVGAAGRGVEAGRAAGAAARWWAEPVSETEPAVRLSLVSGGLGLQWPPASGSGECHAVFFVLGSCSGFSISLHESWSRDPRRFSSLACVRAGRSTEALARGFDVNRAPSTAASALAAEDDEEDQAAGALSSSPNDSAGSFPLDLGRGGGAHGEGATARAGGGGERSSSRASDEDEGASARKKLRLSKEQSAFLEESFKEQSTLNPKQKAALAKQLNLRPRQVEVWFQNRRARTKLKQTEVDCEYLKRCCEALTEENRRLHKEIAELRALKTAPPFYMHLPATTLSMCPSCERVASNPTSAPAPGSSAPPAKAAAAVSNNSSAAVAPARGGEPRPSSFAALFAATRSFPLASQPRPPAPASNCL
ncbi:unnamed protein product [Urochloa decumbens]|uniref:Homeobox domain-containing protein n=1 Tax=Urochloa decumbens TaxID=240449 RepID=A0ABC9BCX9_9POAL